MSKKREVNFIECHSCNKLFDRVNRSFYCKDCREIERKKKHAIQEKARRDKKKDEINEKRRKEYKDNPERKKMCNEAAKKSYEKYMNDPKMKKELNERTRKHQVNYRIRSKFGGNGSKALERDDFKCVRCNSTEILAVHHIDGNGSNLPEEFQNNELINLITLCASCHAREHRASEKHDKTSQYVGVWKRKNIWQSKIRHKGKNYYLGTFKTEEEAFESYLNKKKELKIE